jgi:hypothetical protein
MAPVWRGEAGHAPSLPDKPTGVRPWTAFAAGFTPQDRMNAAVSIGRHLGDDRFDFIDEIIIREWWPSTGFRRTLSHALSHV